MVYAFELLCIRALVIVSTLSSEVLYILQCAIYGLRNVWLAIEHDQYVTQRSFYQTTFTDIVKIYGVGRRFCSLVKVVWKNEL